MDGEETGYQLEKDVIAFVLVGNVEVKEEGKEKKRKKKRDSCFGIILNIPLIPLSTGFECIPEGQLLICLTVICHLP